MINNTRVKLDDRTYTVLGVRNGGMGRVWLLEQALDDLADPVYSKRVAVKTFDFMKDSSAVERELNIWISLDHAAILPLRRIGRLNYRLAAIMPWMAGSLEDLLELKGALGESEAVRIVADVLAALEYAWSRYRVLHLDLKPSNILYNSISSPKARVADWGISRLGGKEMGGLGTVPRRPDDFQAARKTKFSAGTPIYMAPERFSGSWELSPAADIYSVGLLLIQMSTGALPFRFGDIDPISEIFNGECVLNSTLLLERFSAPFRQLCLRCIDPDARMREDDFGSVREQLLKLL